MIHDSDVARAKDRRSRGYLQAGVRQSCFGGQAEQGCALTGSQSMDVIMERGAKGELHAG